MGESGGTHSITVDQLQIGLYVYLDLGWMDHPFSFNNFKIRTADQIRTIRSLGLKKLRWSPEKSDVKPLPPGQPLTATQAAEQAAGTGPAQLNAVDEAALEAKKKRMEKLQVQRQDMAKMEQAFINAATTVRAINKNIFSQPKETVEQAAQLVKQMVDAILAAPEVAIHAMLDKPGSEDVYFHSLNVAVLAMMLGRELALPAEIVSLLGVGSLFHDVGLSEVPNKILNKAEPQTKSERDFREMHCEYGVDIGCKAGLPPAALQVIIQHHECYDGSGYPRKLKAGAIDLMARIVGMVNHYDNLCNPPSLAAALTPHEALSQMYAQQRARFDPKLLQLFIRCMGVYPPGTVVKLTNEVVGLVTSVNASKPLKPSVIVYDPEVPKHEAIILDLEQEPDIHVVKAIRPGQLPRDVYEYLSPRKRPSYYFDASDK